MKKTQGEFYILLDNGDTYVAQNQFTILGMQQILQAAFWDSPLVWQVGLCAHNPADSIVLSAVNEPAIGTGGYARQDLPGNPTDWPSISQINGESYVESREFIIPGTAPGHTVATNRLFLTDGVNVIAVSSPLIDGLVFRATPLTAKYRLFFR